MRGFSFVTAKPQVLVLNLDEEQVDESKIPNWDAFQARVTKRSARVVRLFGRLEMDLADLSPEEGKEFTAGLGIEEPGRERLIAAAYRLLGLISFFTCGPDEVRAWTLREGQTAVDAAGAIHSDLARGFIRAQVVAFDDYVKYGNSFAQCRDAGCLRLEGKEYLVKDGDIIEIRFNV